ncbi:SIR2 family protein [Plantibacter sp. CFBP 8804]|uniref:SIR2 family protein n=1 Tax=Plantibacter sp. CFBP 8804 TaxID=2775270 RepID=UPI00177F7EB0|nr:SIR2 family protein [Plantibacter sp. CFBP 8804]MBD8517282.1 SIR2 family protein [Plantibacter sp. CFBP 8804]
MGDVAVLVGNGLSVAFNRQLALQAITAEVLRRLEAESTQGGRIVKAMQQLAARALPDGASSDGDFEVLVGAFGAESRTLQHLQSLARLQLPHARKLRRSIKRTRRFARTIRDSGVSHVLEVIAERSRGGGENAEDLHHFVEALRDGFDGEITIGNLNYDTLLLSALTETCRGSFADLGDGRKRLNARFGGVKRSVQPLRASADEFPSHRIRLLQAHGSVTYWKDARSRYAKLPIEMMRETPVWRSVRNNTTKLRPVVVLANQRDKATQVAKYPFSLVYDMLSSAFRADERWLVVGYSFRDACINERLRKALKHRRRAGLPIEVLVVTLGDELSRDQVLDCLGWREDRHGAATWLTIDRDGASGIERRQTWQHFTR